MAVDFKIFRLALDLFLKIEKKIGMQDIPPSGWEKYKKDVSWDVAIMKIQNLILCRYHFFGCKLMELEKDLHLYKNNDVDFYRYLQENMSKYFPYPDMHIFDKLSMSCAVVLKMSHLLYLNDIYRGTAPICWAMYFEVEFKEEYYAAGSFLSLIKYAESKATGIILDWPGIRKAFKTDLERADRLYNLSKFLYSFSTIYDIFKQRINLPTGSSKSPKCLPLFDLLYSFSFGRKLNDDFQLLEGYLQMFLRMWFSSRTDKLILHKIFEGENENFTECKNFVFSETRTMVNKLFQARMFVSRNIKSSVESRNDHVLKCCIFCGEEKNEKSVAYLKSIIQRTVSDIEFEVSTYSEIQTLKHFLMLGVTNKGKADI